MDYLRQKHAAMKRQAAFDAAPRALRDVWNATGSGGDALVLLRSGVRTFADAEKVIAELHEAHVRRLTERKLVRL